jgi:mobilome CxxCx(11)CxxC protein
VLTEDPRQSCWTKAIHAYGTGYLFERRARRYGTLLKVVAFLGIGVPAAVGALIAAFGTGSNALSWVLPVAGVLGVAQVVVSAWSLVAGWQNAHAYSNESASDNYRLAGSFERLARDPPPDLSAKFEVLLAENGSREAADYKQELGEKEKRRALRAAFRHYERPCPACGIVPRAIRSTSCGVCGQF